MVDPALIRHVATLLTPDPSLILEWGPSTEWINPDHFHGQKGAIAFLYTTDGQIYYGDENADHFGMIESTPELLDRYDVADFFTEERQTYASEDLGDTGTGLSSDYIRNLINNADRTALSDIPSPPELRQVAMEYGDLLGRIGRHRQDDIKIAAFWNDDDDDYQLLPQCLQRLIADGYLTDSDYFSTPLPVRDGNDLQYIRPIASVQQTVFGQMSPEQQAGVALWQKLHMLPPDQKRAAMQKLGLIPQDPAPTKSAWQQASEQTGLVQPGQKWWAPTSEAFIRRLAETLTVDPDVQLL